MKVVLRVPEFAPVPEVVKFVQRAEDAGFDGVGLIDSQMITRDVIVTMAAAAVATKRIRLVPAVTNPISRHISIWASAAQSLDELAPDRIEIWMGRGFSALNLAGLPFATPRQLRQSIVDMKRLMAGEWDVFPGVHTHIQNASKQIPIRVAASGPMALKIAGAVGDSVLISAGIDIDAINAARELVYEGARSVGRDPATLDISYNIMTSIRENREDAYRWASPVCARNLGNAEWLKARGIDGRGLQAPPELNNLYPDFFHAEDWNYAMEKAAFVPDDLLAEMAPHLGFVGSPEDVVEKMEMLSRNGVKEVFFQNLVNQQFPEDELKAFERVIGPAAHALP